ncbi:HAD family phosphatase [Candidatus Woesearchaeota archaeon]|jgi:epoxide hydrolase-like predicted phosphatase|nr:HAD family phosphatase [Candidatus Woesearchaeota archaeon]
MIKAIIFDWGGVISIHGKFTQYYQEYKDQLNVTEEKYVKVATKYWNQVKIDEISCNSFWNNLGNDLNIDPKKLQKEIFEYYGFNEEVWNLIKDLKPNYHLALLSNNMKEWFDKLDSQHNFTQIFDTLILSHDVKLAKPDEEIFLKAQNKLPFSPEECLFIDDQPRNITPAKKIGFNTILFTNANQLKEELKKFNINV